MFIEIFLLASFLTGTGVAYYFGFKQGSEYQRSRFKEQGGILPASLPPDHNFPLLPETCNYNSRVANDLGYDDNYAPGGNKSLKEAIELRRTLDTADLSYSPEFKNASMQINLRRALAELNDHFKGYEDFKTDLDVYALTLIEIVAWRNLTEDSETIRKFIERVYLREETIIVCLYALSSIWPPTTNAVKCVSRHVSFRLDKFNGVSQEANELVRQAAEKTIQEWTKIDSVWTSMALTSC